MRIPKRIKKAIFTTILTMIVVASNIPLSFAQKSVEPKGYVTITMEKFTLGLGYIKEPIKVPFYEGDNYADIVTRLLGEGNYKNTGTVDSGFYLSRVKDNDNRTPNIPQYILDQCGSIDGRQESGWLGEFDYTSMSGWMYCVNNNFPNVGATDRTPQEGDVVRWQFTTYGYGADIGGDGFGSSESYVEIANKDDLTEEVAEINSSEDKGELLSDKEIKEAYDNAYDVLEKVDASQSKVDETLEKLSSAVEEENKEEIPSEPSIVEPSISVNQAIEETSKYMYTKTPNPAIGTNSGEWTILSLARGGYNVSNDYYKNYYENVVKELTEKNGVLSTSKYTEYSRLILGLSSIGKDSRDVGGYNLIEKLSDFNSVKRQGINGPIFALIALDSNNYNIINVDGVSKQTTRDNLIEFILDKEITQSDGTVGGWALSGKVPDPDITAMALQALSNYKESTITKEDGTKVSVKPYIDRAVNVLSSLQLENGGFKSWGSENVESSSQVLVALTSLGIDPKTDERFIKGDGNWIVSAMMDFYSEGGGFKHIKTGNTDPMATDQATYALVSYKRFVKGENKLYDMTDAFSNDNESVQPNAGEILLSGPEKISGDKDTTFDIVIKSGSWPDGEFKLLDVLMDIPSSVNVESIEVSKNLTGGNVDFGVDNNKLRAVYTNTNLENISFESGDMVTIKCKLKEEVKDSLNFKINGLNLKSSSDNTVEMNVDKANIDIGIGEGQGGGGETPDPDPEPQPQPELVSVKELYKGDGTDLIPSDKKAIAITLLNVENSPQISLGDDIKLYYSEEFTNKLSNTTYVALVDNSVSESDLNNIENYKFDKENENEKILFGDADDNKTINAQDALNTLTTWLRKSDAPNNKGIMIMNTTGDSKIDTSDVISLMEKYIKDQDFSVLSK